MFFPQPVGWLHEPKDVWWEKTHPRVFVHLRVCLCKAVSQSRWGRGSTLRVSVCCGMVWVSSGWGLGGAVLRKGSLSSGRVRVCLCVCVYTCKCVCQLPHTKGRGVSCPTDKVSRKYIPTVFPPLETVKRLTKRRLATANRFLSGLFCLCYFSLSLL